ncbi:MAG: hypothetical protein CMP86_02825 [Gammaproteobacteria bacterium]|nr:hypothetical protein [Gammaproteobacteria bacterium]
MIQALVFTDLDGTLLDDRYDLSGAAAAMDRVTELGALVVPVSSKTCAEMTLLREQQRVPTPFIFENGAGIDWGEHQQWGAGWVETPFGVHLQGSSYPDLCEHLVRLRHQLGLNFRGFNELSEKKISELTKLSLQGAHLAKQRLASEPLIGLNTEESVAALERELSERGLLLQKGGRFYTATSRRQKSDAVAEIVALLQGQTSSRMSVIVCGDGPNDLSMLSLGDTAMLFSCSAMHVSEPAAHFEMKNYLSDTPTVRRLVKVSGAGHEAWSRALIEELSP